MEIQRRLQFFIQFPEYLALFKGDMYLKQKDAEAFSGALARLLFLPDAAESPGVGQEAVPRPVLSAPDAVEVGGPPSIPGLREIVAAVVAILAEMAIARPQGERLDMPPSFLTPAAGAPPIGPPAGAWSPPSRPGPTGPASSIRRTFYDMLGRS